MLCLELNSQDIVVTIEAGATLWAALGDLYVKL